MSLHPLPLTPRDRHPETIRSVLAGASGIEGQPINPPLHVRREAFEEVWFYQHQPAEALGVRPGDRFLDVGGGHDPHPLATVLCDLDIDGPGDQRGNHAIARRPGLEVRQGDVQALPFADDAFDFVYARQLLEHVDDPARACAELQRVAPRGYIETPAPLYELLYPMTPHKWHVQVDSEGRLLFVRKPAVRPLWSLVAVPERAHITGQHLGFEYWYTSVLWARPFEVRVVDEGGSPWQPCVYVVCRGHEEYYHPGFGWDRRLLWE